MGTVGILGGGQLARMLALAATPLGARLLVMDTVADACAGSTPENHARALAAMGLYAPQITIA